MSFAPTAQQADFLSALTDTDNNLALIARAGCGKTSTIVTGAEYFTDRPRDVNYLAFNRSIADELKTRLPGEIRASTFHSACLSALSRALPKRPQTDKFKTKVIAKSVIPEDRQEHYKYCVPRLVSLAKNSGVLVLAPNEIQTYVDLAILHSIEKDTVKTDWHEAGKYCAQIIERSYKSLDVIDFDDMLWLTYCRQIQLYKYPFIFTDESQDFNAVQLALLSRMTYPTSSVIAVGDPYQAIYGFRGAHQDSMNLLAETFSMRRLQLTISFRCRRVQGSGRP